MYEREIEFDCELRIDEMIGHLRSTRCVLGGVPRGHAVAFELYLPPGVLRVHANNYDDRTEAYGSSIHVGKRDGDLTKGARYASDGEDEARRPGPDRVYHTDRALCTLRLRYSLHCNRVHACVGAELTVW